MCVFVCASVREGVCAFKWCVCVRVRVRARTLMCAYMYVCLCVSESALWVGYRIDPLPCHACRKRRLRQEQLTPKIKGLV